MFSFSVRFFPPKLCMHVYAPRYVTYFSPIRFLGFINCVIFGEMQVSQSSSVCNFLKLKILYLHGAAGIKRYRFCPATTWSYPESHCILFSVPKHINCVTYSVM
jgi:hypothetical protein